MKRLGILLITLFTFSLVSQAQTEEITDADVKLFKLQFINGCKGSKVKGMDKADVSDYCDCSWKYFEENYTLEDYNRLGNEAGNKKEIVNLLMSDEGLVTHVLNCYMGKDLTDETEMPEGEESDEKALIKEQTTKECIAASGKKGKKLKGIDVEGYCSCATDKMFDNFTYQEIMDKKFTNGEEFEKLMVECLLENIK